jgi:ribosomal protein L17
MRHSRVINHLGRTSSHRKSMLSNMASSLILHKRITTTTAKAKALRTFVEPLITKSKEDSTHSRRTVFSYLKDKEAVAELFREVSPKIAERQVVIQGSLKQATGLVIMPICALLSLWITMKQCLAEEKQKPSQQEEEDQ